MKFFIVFITVSYFILCTGLSGFSPNKGYYGLLADAFMNFQTHLLVKPHPKLLKLSDPYDPDLNISYRLHDASLFQGRYYLYWGPVPGVIRAMFLNKLPEQFFIYFYTLGSTLMSLLILWRIVNYVSKNYSRFLLYASYIIIAFNGIVLNLLASKNIYYEAIAAAQLFFLFGIFFTIVFLKNKKYKTFFFATLFFSLSIGSRISYIIPSSAIILLLIIYQIIECNKIKKSLFPHLKKIFIASIPLIIIAVLLALYNYIRFGSIIEFGMNFQLAAVNLHTKNNLFTIQNIAINLKNYLFNLPHMSTNFPFISLNPKYYSNVERIVISIFVLSPLTLIVFFKKPSGIYFKKIYAIFILSILLILLFVSYYSFRSITRFIFEYIYLFNILSAALLLLNTKTNREKLFHKIYILIAALVTVFLGMVMWINAIAEYNTSFYFSLRKIISLILPY